MERTEEVFRVINQRSKVKVVGIPFVVTSNTYRNAEGEIVYKDGNTERSFAVDQNF